MNTNITILPAAAGIKKAYEMSLKSDNLDIVYLTENYENVIDDYFDKEYAKKLYDGKRATREILPDSPDNRAYAKKKGTVNKVKFIKAQAEMDMVLSDTAMFLISYNTDQPYAVVITDEELVKGIKSQFEALWQRV